MTFQPPTIVISTPTIGFSTDHYSRFNRQLGVFTAHNWRFNRPVLAFQPPTIGVSNAHYWRFSTAHWAFQPPTIGVSTAHHWRFNRPLGVSNAPFFWRQFWSRPRLCAAVTYLIAGSAATNEKESEPVKVFSFSFCSVKIFSSLSLLLVGLELHE